jgi:hypothetical protein
MNDKSGQLSGCDKCFLLQMLLKNIKIMERKIEEQSKERNLALLKIDREQLN